MTRAVLAFAALLGAPASAFLCRAGSLPIYLVFPVLGVLEGGAGYLKRIAALSLPPIMALVWAYFFSPDAVLPALRWLGAAAAGSFFAWVLGTSGTAMVLRRVAERVPFLRKPLDPLMLTMLLAGPGAELTGVAWKETRGMESIEDRIAVVMERVLSEVQPGREAASISLPSAVFSGLGWLFLVTALAGLL